MGSSRKETTENTNLDINFIGSGCIAALEAEKFLAEQEDAEGLDNEKEVKKGEGNAEALEYRSNPLL